MSLFQKSVINKYLKNIDNEKVSKAFENFKKFYGDKLRLHNIMLLKEENYQEGFLREIFVDVLGYTINPNIDYNLTTEYKNQKDARKADGAILKDGKAIGVIELKSTKTKHLESIKEQAFSYKNNQPGCKYVITSNFQTLRFYIDDATEFEDFNLFSLTEKGFKLLYLLLSKESIFSDLPERMKQETKFHENDISAQLYTDYKRFKDKIFENLVKNNPQYDKLLLFKKSQKLLDRFLFVFFAEDSGLIPPNTISKIIEQWKQLQELDEYMTLYSRFQKLFSHLDKGHTYKKWGEIPAYNGGLFRDDELLDSNKLKIDDEVLEKDSLTLSAYDFNTEVDVNILGHIFEHSLNEIENITAQLQGEEIDKKKTKRKKDGIFYTPKYITKYIVENTVGTLCKEKKEELKINNLFIDESYRKTDGKLKEKGKKLYKTFDNYKKWLLTLKILDPACGSGAFLNATLDFLIAEHKQIDNLIAELTGDALGLFDTDKAILENNIYGVDINEESVEIAKLSMWLRTAQKGRPLSNLSGNIKCGNSLIDDPEVAGDKAFDWHKEFPQIFNPEVKEKVYQKEKEAKPNYIKLIKEKTQKAEKLAKEALEISKQVYEYAEKIEQVSEPKSSYGINKGGFDVVLGNPPYVDNRGFDKKELHFLYKAFPNSFEKSGTDKFKTTKLNLIAPFIELNKKILKIGGYTSYIFHKNIFKTNSYTSIRRFILKNFDIKLLTDWGAGQFKDVVAETATFILKKGSVIKDSINVEFYNLAEKKSENIQLQSIFLDSEQYIFGIYASIDDRNILKTIEKNSHLLKNYVKINNGIVTGNDKQFLSKVKVNDKYKKVVRGKDIKRYNYLSEQEYILYDKDNLLRARNESIFKSEEKLIMQMININFVLTYDNNQFYNLGTTYAITNKSELNIKYLLNILNSKLINYYYQKKFTNDSALTNAISTQNLFNISIKQIPKQNQQPFIEKADQMLSLNKELQSKSDKFIKRIKSNLEVEKITKKLQNFYDFDFKTFLAELKKQKIKLSLTQQDEWEDYFDTYKKGINELQTQISQTDNEIDKMVYELYGLTDEEIRIVEESVK